MAVKITNKGKPLPRGEKFTGGAGFRIVATTGKLRYWIATLVGNTAPRTGEDQFVIFKVRKPASKRKRTTKSKVAKKKRT